MCPSRLSRMIECNGTDTEVWVVAYGRNKDSYTEQIKAKTTKAVKSH